MKIDLPPGPSWKDHLVPALSSNSGARIPPAETLVVATILKVLAMELEHC
jgi:hypothetical protein